MKSRKLSTLKPIAREELHAMSEKGGCKNIKFCVDSGAGETVVDEDDLPEVETKESWGGQAWAEVRGR